MRKTKRRMKVTPPNRFSSGILFLCGFSLIGIGFSSWVYNETSQSHLNLEIGIGDVAELQDYLTVKEVSHFDICPTSLVVDETIAYRGDISITLNLELKNGLLTQREDLTDTLSFIVDIRNEGTFNFFAASYMGSATPDTQFAFYQEGETPTYYRTPGIIRGDTVHTEPSYFNANLRELERITITLIYSFDFSAFQADFQTRIYDRLGEEPLAFSLSAEVL